MRHPKLLAIIFHMLKHRASFGASVLNDPSVLNTFWGSWKCRVFQASSCIISPSTRTWSACALRFLDVNVVGWGLDDGGLKAEALLMFFLEVEF